MTVFCPSCGKPNTEQASHCVACGYKLDKPRPAGRFKGTMMMSGTQKPAPTTPAATTPGDAATDPAAERDAETTNGEAAAPAPAPTSDLAYQKTMAMHSDDLKGPAPGIPESSLDAAAAFGATDSGPTASAGEVSTGEQVSSAHPEPAPVAGPPARPSDPTTGAGAAGLHEAPAPAAGNKKPNPILLVALGCGGLSILGCCLGSLALIPLLYSNDFALLDEENAKDEPTPGPDEEVCARAARCCEAYVRTVSEETPGVDVDVASTCAAVRNLAGLAGADSGCRRSMETWRRTLEELSRPVPNECESTAAVP